MLFKPKLPVIAAADGQNEKCAEQDICRAQGVHRAETIGKIRAEDFQRQPEGEGEAKELIEQAELHAGLPLEVAPQPEHDHEQTRYGERFNRDRRTIGQFGKHHRGV